MKKLLPLAVALAAATLLTACGGGGGDDFSPPAVATQDVVAPIRATTVAAVAGETFDFSSGVADLGTTTATTLQISAPAAGSTTNTFALESSEGRATGNLGFGSCIFTVTESTFPASHPLATGKEIEVDPCALNVPSAGVSTEGGATERAATFTLGTATSTPEAITVAVRNDGTVVVNGAEVGTVSTSPTTGASGS